MPRKPSSLVVEKPQVYEEVFKNFGDGVISVLGEARLPKTAVKRAKNLLQVEDNIFATRPGSHEYGEVFTGPIAGGCEFVKDNGDGTTTQYILIIDNGVPKYSQDGGSWTTITGVTFDPDAPMCFLQLREQVLMANAVDPFSFLDIATMDIFQFSGIATPSTPSLTLGSGLAAGSYNAYYQISAVNEVGETVASAEADISVNARRDDWSGITNANVKLTWPAVTGALRYNIFYADQTGFCVYLDSIEATASPEYTDNGTVAVNDFIESPVSDTTSGPKFGQMRLSGNRVWSTGDPEHPQRSYWMGTGAYSKSISPFFGGGYVDIEKGGRERPRVVVHYRDGRGTPLATVLTSDPDGNGSTCHIELITQAIGDTQITIPAVYKVLGSVGTTSPLGVIESKNNIYFPTVKGFYSLGSKPQLLNVLTTDEVSANIRPDIKAIKVTAMDKICGIEWDGKLLWSVAYNSEVNNRIFVLDLEKRNWNPEGFDFGAKQFFMYTDNDGVSHLLCVPVVGNKLIEISDRFVDDNGKPIETHLQLGITHVSADHIQFAHIDRVYVELGRPRGLINVSISGAERSLEFHRIVSKAISGFVGTSDVAAGFSTYGFSSRFFSYSARAATAFALSSVKKWVKVNKLLNNYQIDITSNSLNTYYAVNQIIVVGRFVPTSPPSRWRT